MKIGMYSSDEIYEELANGFLARSMVDAIYFEIKKLREENQQLKKQKDDVVEYINTAIEEGNYFEDDIDTDIQPASYDKYVNSVEILRMLGEIDDNKGIDE